MRTLIGVCLVVILNGFGSHRVAAGEVVAIDYLNKMLATKRPITYERIAKAERQICQPPPPCHVSRGEGECENREPRCHTEYYDVVQSYSDYARVTSTEIISVTNLTFDNSRMVALPEKGLLQTLEYQLCDPNASVTTTLTLSVTGTHGYQVTKGDSVSTTVGGSVSTSYNSMYGSASTTLNFSRSIGTSNSVAESFSETVTRSTSVTISPKPGSQGKLEFLAFETTIDVPFSATITVDGALVGNKSNYTNASQLLTETERTLPFRGVLRLTNVSNGLERTTGVPGSPACKGGIAEPFIKNTVTTTFPAKALSDAALKTFSKPTKQNLMFILKSNQSGLTDLVSGDTPGIGPPDGVVYQILFTIEITKPTPMCGYNDVGFPNNAVYSVETREYTQYSNGTIVSRWQDQNETFKNCES
jgi:hypothetical protein